MQLLAARSSIIVLLLALISSLVSPVTYAFAQTNADGVQLPPGFVLETIVKGLDGPTSFALAPDGRIYAAQKSGAVRVIREGRLLPANFIDISYEVNHAYNRGLVGIAVHPDFPRQPFVYLAYVYQPPEANGHKEGGARVARVVRVSADPNNLDRALPDSMVILLGANGNFDTMGNPDRGDRPPPSCQDADGAPLRDCVPVEGTAHQANMMQFGRDGALYVGVGDGGEYGNARLRAQDVNSLSGKILRINPLTGAGYANNPFATRDLTSNRAKVYMLGLRNPFRFAIHPATGELFIGDVGEATWEEVNRGRRSANFGWPCFEGEDPASAAPPCDRLQAVPRGLAFPVYAYPHTEGRVAVVGGDVYTRDQFPAEYRNVYFFGDYNRGTIWMLPTDKRNAQVSEFATRLSGMVQITAGADGNLYVLSVRDGALHRIRWASTAP